MKNSPDVISELNQNEIFVFGSNVNGKHCSGAARIAFDKFGAIWGKGVGVQGNSYAIPTMEGNMQVLNAYICDFIEYARTHPKKLFLVTRIGCGIAGYKDEQIAPMFANAMNIQNILLPRSFLDVLLPFQKKLVPEYYHYNGMKYCKDMVCNMTFSKKCLSTDFGCKSTLLLLRTLYMFVKKLFRNSIVITTDTVLLLALLHRHRAPQGVCGALYSTRYVYSNFIMSASCRK